MKALQKLLNNIKLSVKIPLAIASAAVITGAVIGVVIFNNTKKEIIELEQVKLEGLLDAKKGEFANYLESIKKDLYFNSVNPFVKDALNSFKVSYREFPNPTEDLQRIYITENPNPLGQKNSLDKANDGSLYSEFHGKFHPWFNTFLNERGYYDIFLFDLQGNLVYTVFKELDYATNMYTGQWKDTDLARAFIAAKDNPGKDKQFYFDFKPYTPSNGVPAAFISQAILDENGKPLGVLVYQMPIGEINEIINTAAGLGETGDSFVIGSDFLARNDSRFVKEGETSILQLKYDTEEIRRALKGEEGSEVTVDYNGEKILNAFDPFDFMGNRFAFVVSVKESEILAPLNRLRDDIIIIVLISVLATVVLGYLFSSMLVGRVGKLTHAVSELAKGNVAKIDDTTSKDEIGNLSKNFALMAKDVDRNNAILRGASGNIMFANNDRVITYMNDSVQKYLKKTEGDIKKDLPQFDADNLIGVSIDNFHKNPAHQRMMLEKLNGEFKTSISLGGRNFDLIAYPVFDRNGERLGSVVEWQDETITDYSGQANAISRSQAVIHFDMKGTILNANENFLNVMGYSLDEIKGRHHSMFAEPDYAASNEYKEFWEELRAGKPKVGEFKRKGKGGKEVWINASYNPIMDLTGRPYKVVKYATDVTDMVNTRTENEAGTEECVGILRTLSQGNLNSQMEGDYKGTFSDIKEALNSTIENLRDMVTRIANAANIVASASSEISDASTNLSARTEQQASNLEETSASMEQMTSSVRENSDNANRARDLSSTTMNVANKGGEAVRKTVGSIKSIEESSKKISDIIGVIDEIAFQTNLLALNAAVEAARAGDAGKGFAVVADEVRTLAGRSAQASKEIKDLIVDSVDKVKSGVDVAEGAGHSIEEILKSVTQLTELVANIANATSEQSSGIEQVNSAIASLDEMTQQNAAMVEENTASAESMSRQARDMQGILNFFKVDGLKIANSANSNNYMIDDNLFDDSDEAEEKPKPKAGSAKDKKSLPRQALSSANSKTSMDDGWEEF